MAVKLRLMRMGKKKQPTYRVVAADARSPRDGRFIEIVGIYEPRRDPSHIKIDNERAVHWLRHGAQPTERVEKLLKISGAWEDFTGEAAPAMVTRAASAEEAAPAAEEAAPVEEAAPAAEAGEETADEAQAEGPHGAGSHAPLEDASQAPEGFPIKGNEDSMKYHTPESPWYDRTVAEVWFASAEAAEAAGFAAAVADEVEAADEADAGAEAAEETQA
ncbi:MAG: 30S ribosomal protein S16 [Acidimicrobiales bacterium]